MDSTITHDDFELYMKSEDLMKKNESTPADETFQSKYDARALLEILRLKLSLKYVQEKSVDAPNLNIMCAYAFVLYKLAINHLETEERAASEEFLISALGVIDEHKIRPEMIFLYISVQNYMSFIYAVRDSSSSLEALLAAQDAYRLFKRSTSGASLHPERILQFVCESAVQELPNDKNQLEQDSLKFEQLYNFTLFYLAQYYKNIDEPSKAAPLCFETLVRQMTYGDYNVLEWCLNAATLSQYYLSPDGLNFPMARRCLAWSIAALDGVEKTNAKNDTNKCDDNSEKFDQCRADAFRCFAKYGLTLLDVSKNCKDTYVAGFCLDCDLSSWNWFDYKKYENLITDQLVNNFDSARAVYMSVRAWLNESKKFYTLNDRASDYVELICNHSLALKLLAEFELDVERRRQMHKKRADLLVELLPELNPRHFGTLRRQLMLDLAEIYTNIFEAAERSLEETADNPKNKTASEKQNMVRRINSSAKQAIKFYEDFLDSFKNEQGQFPAKFDESDVKAVVAAHLYCGRFYNKAIYNDKLKKIAACQKGLDNFRWVVDYCENVDTNSLCIVREEYEVCKEMFSLYTLKIDRLKII